MNEIVGAKGAFTGCPTGLTEAEEKSYAGLCKENQKLKEEIKQLELIVGLNQKRKLISKFDKEYNEDNKKKHPNENHAEIMPDAEEVYKRYYKQKEVIDKLNDYMYSGYLINSKEIKDILKEVE